MAAERFHKRAAPTELELTSQRPSRLSAQAVHLAVMSGARAVGIDRRVACIQVPETRAAGSCRQSPVGGHRH